MKTLITGAFGRVGTALMDNLQDQFDLRYFDKVDHPMHSACVGDIADYPAVAEAFDGIRNVVHLAAASRVDATWPEVLQANIIGSYNCLEAAKRREVQRVVLASSNHVVGMYETDHAPEIYEPGYDLKLDRNSPVRPDSFYAISKVFSETLARYFVENHDYPKRVYVLRLGSVRSPGVDHPYADAERGVEENRWKRGSTAYQREVKRLKATWLSRHDVASLVKACLEDNTITYDVFYGTSDNDRSWFDIDYPQAVLDYNPRDSGDEWNDPPA